MTDSIDADALRAATATALDRPEDDAALAFTPVPVRERHDGWTAARQRIFIRALAETACVEDACNAAGVTARSAYRLRVRKGAESFDAAWREALQIGVHHLTTLAFQRAIHGTPRTVRHKGREVGTEWVPSDRLLMFLLKHYDRSRYGNLSGFLKYDVPDPTRAALGALPGALDRLRDQPPVPGADHHEQFADFDMLSSRAHT